MRTMTPQEQALVMDNLSVVEQVLRSSVTVRADIPGMEYDDRLPGSLPGGTAVRRPGAFSLLCPGGGTQCPDGLFHRHPQAHGTRCFAG